MHFSQSVSGERIWGRGSSDDKSGLIGLLSVFFASTIGPLIQSDVKQCTRAATEDLITAGFSPTRSVVLAFGFDEESGGRQVGLRFLAYTPVGDRSTV